MNPNLYSTDPSSDELQGAYRLLDPMARLVYREILDLMWLSEDKYRMPLDHDLIGQMLSMKAEDIERHVGSIADPACGLFLQDYDMTSGMVYLRSEELQRQWKLYQTWAADQESKMKSRKEAGRKGLSSRIEEEKRPADVSVQYIKPDRRYGNPYDGWLPTARFDSNGQAYRVRQSVIDQLKESYPKVDVDEQLPKVYDWLLNNPERRRPLAHLNGFISSWLDRAGFIEIGKTSPRTEPSATRIDDAFDDLLSGIK